MTHFDKWYADRFGMLMENEQQERAARDALRAIFNNVVEVVAREFDGESFAEYDGIQVTSIIRGMKDEDETAR